MQINQIIYGFLTVLQGAPFLLLVKSLAIIAKSIVLGRIIHARKDAKVPGVMLVLGVLFLISNLWVDIAWIITLLRRATIFSISKPFAGNVIRFGWIISTIEHTALALFIDSFTASSKNPSLKLHQKIYLFFSVVLTMVGSYFFIYFWNTPLQRFPSTSLSFVKLTYLFYLAIIIYSLVHAFRAFSKGRFPKILTAQLKTFLAVILLPLIILEYAAFNPFADNINEIYLLNAASTLLIAYGFYFFAKRMMRLRFLNARSHTETTYDKDFIIKFKKTLEELAQVTTLAHMRHVTDTFFKNTLEIPADKVNLFFRSSAPKVILEDDETVSLSENELNAAVEKLLSEHEQQKEIKQFLYKHKILILDELEFTNFYEKDHLLAQFTQFLHTIKADVFVPIFEQKVIIGYIVVAENARGGKLYGSVDRDKMLIFSTYLGNIVNLLQHNNWDALTKEQKNLKEELYHKHQEVNQYKESIRSFIRTNRERKIGIVFYKNRKFSLANQAAQDLIKIDLNQEQGHELTQACIKIAKNVEEYKTAQSILTKDEQGNKLVVSGIPSAASSYVIITLYYPEITDTISSKLELLNDPSQWDYVLYLETTASGKLINTLIPGSSEPLINFKIQLLQAALSRKALFLDMPKDDLKPTVEIIHHISLRNELQVLTLAAHEKNYEVAIKLFGINPLFSAQAKEVPLLEKLDGNGTLYIENIELLSLETQNSLAEYLTYGYYKPMRSDRKIVSNARIICSTNHNIELLVKEGAFSANLYAVLSQTTLTFPSLVSLKKGELSELMDSYVEQAVTTKEFKSLVTFNERERNNLLDQKPISLQEFKDHVHHLLQQKSHKKNVNEIIFDASTTTDPELQRIVRLGKHALKDPRMMHILWNKFKNQTKIATLLGVNRSSVNRRCKEYNLN